MHGRDRVPGASTVPAGQSIPPTDARPNEPLWKRGLALNPPRVDTSFSTGSNLPRITPTVRTIRTCAVVLPLFWSNSFVFLHPQSVVPQTPNPVFEPGSHFRRSPLLHGINTTYDSAGVTSHGLGRASSAPTHAMTNQPDSRMFTDHFRETDRRGEGCRACVFGLF